MESLKAIFAKYREVIMYLIFGVLTTAVNYLSYIALSLLPVWTTTFPPTAIAWALSVLFAFVTNRIWVFASKASGFRAVTKELTAFVGSRLLSGVIDVAIMYVFVDVLGYNDLIVKLLSNIIVISLNYIFSKLFVFRKKRAE